MTKTLGQPSSSPSIPALRELLDKATIAVSLDAWPPTLREREDRDHDIEQVHPNGEVTQMAKVYGSEPFAALIVAAVNALPALLDVVEAAQAYIDDDYDTVGRTFPDGASAVAALDASMRLYDNLRAALSALNKEETKP